MDPQNPQQPIQPIQPNEQFVEPKSSLPWIKILLAIVLLMLIGDGAYYFGTLQTQKLSSYNSVVPTSVPSKIPTIDPTANWKTYTIKTVGIEFKLPPQLSNLGNLQEQIEPGQKGTILCVRFSAKVGFIPKAYAGGGCFSDNPPALRLGTTAVDYEAGREGAFTDLQGFTNENGKYFAKFVAGKTIELPLDLVKIITNGKGIEILKVIGKNNTTGEFRGPITGTPGDGWIGALINTKNTTYPGIAVQMELKNDLTEQLFDQILSTFKFTN